MSADDPARGRGRPPGSRTLHGATRDADARETDLYLRRIGQIVRDARTERSVSAQSLARAIGAHPRTIHALERGGSPLLTTLIRIARALELAPSELLP